MTFSGHDDSTINIVLGLVLLLSALRKVDTVLEDVVGWHIWWYAANMS